MGSSAPVLPGARRYHWNVACESATLLVTRRVPPSDGLPTMLCGGAAGRGKRGAGQHEITAKCEGGAWAGWELLRGERGEGEGFLRGRMAVWARQALLHCALQVLVRGAPGARRHHRPAPAARPRLHRRRPRLELLRLQHLLRELSLELLRPPARLSELPQQALVRLLPAGHLRPPDLLDLGLDLHQPRGQALRAGPGRGRSGRGARDEKSRRPRVLAGPWGKREACPPARLVLVRGVEGVLRRRELLSQVGGGRLGDSHLG